jgi:hypothetical protein
MLTEAGLNATMAAMKNFATNEARLSSAPVEIIASAFMVDYVQCRFPNSKKKRIQKRWAQRPENYRSVPLTYAFRYGNTFVMHPQFKAKLMAEIGSVASEGWAFFNGQPLGRVHGFSEHHPDNTGENNR